MSAIKTLVAPSRIMEDGFSLFSSLRYDCNLMQVPAKRLDFAGWNYEHESPLYMLDFHRDRILRAATHWKWEPAVQAIAGNEGLDAIARLAHEFVGKGQTNPLRLRITVNRDGAITFAKFDALKLPLENLFPRRLTPPGEIVSPGEPQRTPCYTLVVDAVSTRRSEYTHFKTTNRNMYDAARQRARIAQGAAKEVLVVNQDDESVMEGSVTTPYFWRGGRWVTPCVSVKFSKEEGCGGQDGTTRRWVLER